MHQQRDIWVLGQIENLLARGVGCHNDDGAARVGRGGEVGVAHERDVRHVVAAGCQVQEARVLQALDDLAGEGCRDTHVCVAG